MKKNIIGDIKNEILTLYKEKIVIENSIRRKNEKQMQFLNNVKNRIQLNVVKILKKTIKLNECIAILNDEENIKNLLTQVNRIDEKIKSKEKLKVELEAKKETLDYLFNKVIYSESLTENILKEKIEKRVERKINLKITEHGLLRYIERVKRVNIDSIKGEILDIFEKEDFRKNGVFEKDGVRYIIQGNKVVTVINKVPSKEKEFNKYMLYYSRYRKNFFIKNSYKRNLRVRGSN